MRSAVHPVQFLKNMNLTKAAKNMSETVYKCHFHQTHFLAFLFLPV